jgi:uncharacterized membrane protein
MKTNNADLMRMAKDSLKGKWGLAIGTFLIYILITASLGGGARNYPQVSLISLILNGPLALGAAIFSLSLARNEEAGVEQIFFGFYKFGKALAAYLLMLVFILLWALLLIIPGIIAALSYSMTFYIMADDASISPMEAIDKSKAMMYGYKWKFFCLGLRFLLWSILCILTLGIGFLWLIPWMNVTIAKFYDDIKLTNFTN